VANPASASYDSRPAMFRNHPVWFLALWVLLIAPVVVLLLFRDEVLAVHSALAIALLVLSASCGLALAVWYLSKRATRLRIHDGEIHLEEGLLNKRHIDLRIAQVRAVHVSQSYLDRLMRVGQIDIYTTGDNAEVRVRGMAAPHRVRELIRQHQRENGASV
jgi:uncharacterized membrane protein YdbT with pleckstrin-like domain